MNIEEKTVTAGWQLVGKHHGYIDDTASQAVVDEINRARPDLLLVGMGNPAQEQGIHRHRHRLGVPVCLGIGGLFAYWSGDLDRAHGWVRRLGLEWVHLLIRQPRKAGRYLIEVFIPGEHTTTKSAQHFVVHHEGGQAQEKHVIINQREHMNRWVPLGTFSLDPKKDESGRVNLVDQTTKVGWQRGTLYVERHAPLEGTNDPSAAERGSRMGTLSPVQRWQHPLKL